MFTSVKRVVTAFMALALVASSLAFGGTSAHAQIRTATNVPGKWASAILIQNTGSANLTSGQYSIAFYDTNGSLVNTFSPTDTINVGSSKEFYVPNAVSTLAAGQYSAVISSSQKVKAVVNSSTDSSSAPPFSAFSYEGVDSDATSATLYFPAFYRNYFTFLSELVIQNTGSSAATIQATFYSGTTGALAGTFDLGSIPSNASKTYAWNDSVFAALPSGNSSSLYGVVVKSTNAQLLAGISNIWASTNPTNAGVGSYNAFTTGSATVYLGALYNQYFGFVSSLTVQNVDAAATAAVTITYSDGTVDGPFNLGPNQSAERFQPNKAGLGSGSSKGLLSATVTTTGGSIVAIVNIQRKAPGSTSIADPTNPAFGSYSGTSVASATVNIPAIYYNYAGYFTSVSVKNTGLQATTITLKYSNGITWAKPALPGETVNFTHLPKIADNPLIASPPSGPLGGSVTSSNAMPLVVVIQHNTDPSLSTYRPAKSPNDFLFVLTGFPA
jgi:hypothetical protein